MSKPTTKTAAKMHATQEAYALALAMYETAVEAAKSECIAKGLVIVEGMADAAWEATSAAIDDVEIAHNVWSLQTLRIEAERAMILWSLNVTAEQQPQGSATVAFIRDRVTQGHTRNDEWARLVDLGFRLAA